MIESRKNEINAWLDNHIHARMSRSLINTVSKIDFVEFDQWFSDLHLMPSDDEDDEHPLEPLSFFIVSEWFAARLQEHGHPATHDFYGMNVWGRVTCGQAVCHDGVVQAIYDEYLAANA